MRIGIKVGSALIAASGNDSDSRWINDRFIFELCRQIANLRFNHQVFLVTSGAVACDRNANHSRALKAAIGQGKLIRKYIDAFGVFDVSVAQMLLVAFELKSNREHIRGLFDEALRRGVVPVVNANDAVNSEELDRLEDFADNDVLFTELCLMLEADIAIFSTNSPGLIDEDNDGAVIHAVDERNWQSAVDLGRIGMDKKRFGYGYGSRGILTKLECGKRLSETSGIRTIIADGREDDFVHRAIAELSDPRGEFGTVFRFTPLLPGLS